MISNKAVSETFEYHQDGYLIRKKSKAQNAIIGEKTNFIDSKGYRTVWFNGKTEREHRLIYLMFKGYCPQIIDHIDMNKENNKIENLRPATKSQNNVNCYVRSNNSTGVKGVYFCKTTNKWRARINYNGKAIEIGRFDVLQDAKNARLIREKEIFGEFAKT